MMTPVDPRARMAVTVSTWFDGRGWETLQGCGSDLNDVSHRGSFVGNEFAGYSNDLFNILSDDDRLFLKKNRSSKTSRACMKNYDLNIKGLNNKAYKKICEKLGLWRLSEDVRVK